MTFQLSNFNFQIVRGSTFKRSLWVLVPILLFAIGCAKKSEPAESAADGPMRIVSMAPNLTEILFALGLDEQIVGVTRHCNIPAAALTKRQIGTFWEPDIEAVLAIRPTLVITLGFEQQMQLAGQLEKIGCKTLTVEDFESTRQLYDGILTIGRAVSRQPQAEAMVARLTAAQQRMRDRYAGRPPRKVLWVIQREPLRVAGVETFINEMLQTVGGVNAIGKTLNVYPPIGAEEVTAAAPEVIIEPANMPDQRSEQEKTAAAFYAAFKSVPAVQNGDVYVLDGDLVSRLGPRLDEALEQIAKCLWKE